MNSKKYLLLDSSYRDRVRFPLPAEFEVCCSNSGMKTRTQAVDPIAYSSPVITFNTIFDFNTNNTTLSGNISATTAASQLSGNASSSLYVVGVFANNSLSKIKNYYQGAVLFNSTTGRRSRILEYTFLGNNGNATIGDIGTFQLYSNDIGVITNTDVIVISNPSDFSVRQVFIPTGTYSYNAYVNQYIVNDELSTTNNTLEFAKITSYNIFTKIAIVDRNISTWSTLFIPVPLAAGSVNSTLSIRHDLPILGRLSNPSTSTTTTVTMDSSFVNQPLVGSFLYFPSTNVLPVVTSSNSSLRKIVKSEIIGSNIVVTVDDLFPTTYIQGTFFEFLPFSRDNVVPLNFSGSTLSQQEVSCYEIELIDLIIPNYILTVDGGGFVSKLPFLFVELSNIGSSGGYNSIYSNNPNSTQMLFRVAVPNIADDITSPFICIQSTNVTQTIKFKPNDNLKFSVRMPNGEIFKIITDDTQSPLLPIRSVQISAQFSIKKLV